MMKHQNSIDLLAYWERLRGKAAAPERDQVAPKDIPALLPYVFVLDLADGRPSFRLAGSAICSSHMRELKAMPFIETWVAEDRRQIEAVVEAVGKEMVGAVIGSTASNGKEKISFETLLLPLYEKGNRGSRLIGVQSHFGRPWSLNGFPANRHALVSMRVLAPGNDGPGGFGLSALSDGGETPVIDFSSRVRRRDLAVGRKVGHLTVIEGGASPAGA